MSFRHIRATTRSGWLRASRTTSGGSGSSRSNFQYRIDPKKSTYHDSYRTTAAFLGWCELHYDSGLVTKLSRAVRFGTYNNSLFKANCGKDVDTLWAEFVAAYQADPGHVLTPAVAPADQPRVLPSVTPGTSVPADLSSAFNTTGLFRDGTALPGTGGVDGEGNGYSALSCLVLLPPGKASSSVSARPTRRTSSPVVGQVVPLPPVSTPHCGCSARRWRAAKRPKSLPSPTRTALRTA